MASLEIPNLFDVANKVVLITGGSRGIGKMIAAGFVRNGAKVYISSRSAADCEATARELTALGPGKCICIPADMQKKAEVSRLVSELSAKEKYLDVLVNNAGAAWGAPIDEYPDEAWSKVLTLNLQRVFTLTQLCLPLLRESANRGGREGDVWKNPARIINIGSIEGVDPPSHATFAYSASKAGLHMLSKALAGRLGWEGITSNVLACGPFPSKMTAGTLKQIGDRIVASIPLTRVGKPEDVAGAALFLSSNAGAFVTGAQIVLDGGLIVSNLKHKL